MQPNPLKLDESIRFAEQAKADLLREFPELAEDEQALLDTLDGCTDLAEVIEAFIRSADEDEALCAGAKERARQIAERGKRFDERASKKRLLVARALERAGIKKIERPEFTISLRNVPPAVVVTNETAIPVNFWQEKIVRSLDKTAIKKSLEAGTDVAGAHLSNGGITVAVRRS